MLQSFGCSRRRSAAPTLKRKRHTEGSYRRFRFTVTALADPHESTTQISSLNFYAGGLLLDYFRVVASNPFGQGPRRSGPDKAVDMSTHTKWVDWECQPLLLDFPDAVSVEEVSFTTADDKPGCDPVRFRLEGFNEDAGSWEVLLDRTMQDLPPTPGRNCETPKLLTISTRISRPRLTVRDDLIVGSCVICLEEHAATMAIAPCGHQALCHDCAGKTRIGGPCPVCRLPIQSVIKVFLAAPEALAPAERDHLKSQSNAAQEAASRLAKEAEEARSQAAAYSAEKENMEKQREWMASLLTKERKEKQEVESSLRKTLEERNSRFCELQHELQKAVAAQRVGEAGSSSSLTPAAETLVEEDIEIVSFQRCEPTDAAVAELTSLVECSPRVARKALERVGNDLGMALNLLFEQP